MHETIVFLSVCICMEFGHGGDLFSHLSRRGALPESEAARLFTHLLRALEFCHRTVHLCHRDVKPENLLFDSTDSKSRVLKLVDFGLSCPISESMLQGACGTPVYSAPEVFAQRYDGVRADLWSAAVTLYVMVSGRLPFEVEHPMRQQSMQLSSRSSLNMHGSSLHGSSLNMQSSNTQGSSLNSGSSSGTTSIPTNGGLGTGTHAHLSV
jgi:serine/threonine protein kinase